MLKTTGELWWQFWCPHCEAENWICDGDPTDITKLDVAMYPMRCRVCKEVFMLGEDGAEIDMDGEPNECCHLVEKRD